MGQAGRGSQHSSHSHHRHMPRTEAQSIRSPLAWDEGSPPAVTQMWDATQALLTCPSSWEGGRENHTTSRKA